MSQPFLQECLGCGRTFSDIGAFTKHGKKCSRGKKRLASALGLAKELYESKKRRLPVPDSNHAIDELGLETTNSEQNLEVVQEPYAGASGQQVLWT